jgi:hypothetical protein
MVDGGAEFSEFVDELKSFARGKRDEYGGGGSY